MGRPKFGSDCFRTDSGASFEELAVRHGHYPENRSENKGSEPEAIEYGRFRGDDYLFVGSERGSFVAVYEMKDAKPEFVQVLPAPLRPEGLLAIPKRGLLVASGEVDDPTFGVRSSIMIYKLTEESVTHPQILSANKDGSPIPWSAMSGMTSIPGSQNELLAVWDSFYSTSKIFTLDTSREPALVTDELTIGGGAGDYDPEGIAVAPDGTYWIASEGDKKGERLNRLLQVETDDFCVFIERDNRTGDFAELKTLVKVDKSALSDGISRSEKTTYNLILDLEASNGWITDKLEGVAITER